MANNNYTVGSNTLMSAEEGELEKQALIEHPTNNSAAIEEGEQNGNIDNQENNFHCTNDEQGSKPTE